MSKFLKSTIGHPSYEAAKLLIDHLEEASQVVKYRPAGSKIDEVLDDSGLESHVVTLPAPAKGFSDEFQEYVKRYAEGLTYWDPVLFEIELKDKALVVTFREVQDEEEEEEAKESQTLRQRIQVAVCPIEYKVARAAGTMFVQNGFKVREPTPAQVIMKAKTYSGYAQLLRYPVSRKNDEIGITGVYDRLVPLMADAIARSQKLHSETQIDAEYVTIFFTKNREYKSSLFDTAPEFRIIVPRRKISSISEWGIFKKATYKACRRVYNQYRKDFLMIKRPQALFEAEGHCLIMHYRKGAGGKVVDESYVLAIRRMAEKLMKQYRIRASIQIRPETRTIILSFMSDYELRPEKSIVQISGQTGSVAETTRVGAAE